MKVFVILALLCLQSNADTTNKTQSTEGDELVFAHVIFRHGDRTILRSYPTDPWSNASYWPEGFGQLTNLGIKQQYELGKYLRRRYRKLLGDGSYSSDVVYVQSTDIERTLSSASANMAGLFPPAKEQVWKSDLRWQPIPIHTIPTQLDHILYEGRVCPRYQHAVRDYQASEEVKTLLREHKQLMEYLEAKSGVPMKSIRDVEGLYNTLWIENLKNLTLPEWTNDVFKDGSEFEWIAFRDFQTDTNTPLLARLSVGFLLREMLDRFTSKAKSNETTQSLWIYSAHDSTIANLLNSLRLFEPHNPPYASSLHFEMYKSTDRFYLQIVYRNTSAEMPLALQIPNCGTQCTIEEFETIYKEVIPSVDFEAECKLRFYQRIREFVDIPVLDECIVAIVIVALFAMISVIIVWRLCSRKRGNIKVHSNQTTTKFL